jgi:hypothetical protein
MSERRGLFGLSFETIGSIAAIVVGVAAILVSWDQGRVMRAQQHASVLPAVQIDGHVSEDAGRLSAGLRLSNNGVGPALIHDFTLEINGERVTSWDQLSARAPGESGRNWSTVTGRILGPGETITAIDLFWDLAEGPQIELDALRAFIAGLTDTAEVSVCYCSVFERCFISRTSPHGASLPAPTPRCPEISDWINQVELDPGSPDAP